MFLSSSRLVPLRASLLSRTTVRPLVAQKRFATNETPREQQTPGPRANGTVGSFTKTDPNKMWIYAGLAGFVLGGAFLTMQSMPHKVADNAVKAEHRRQVHGTE